MDQAIRNKLRGVVTKCRKLLEEATAQALQGRFGIYAARKKGEVQVEEESRMAHLTEEDRACRQDLLDHLEHIQAIGYKPSEALEQLVREIAFTHLNRLCAYKMMEAQGLIREAVSRGLKSQGFFFYLSDHPEDEKLHSGGRQEAAYRNFLDWLGGTLSQEIGVLFNPNDPANRIYPPQRVLDEALALINDGELSGIWSQDETIGWVYQYFTPKELRDRARRESQAPRNSYELAFRNQFFTPRYVVEFLTDNTLGRIWYEMRKGKTVLKDRCRYLVRRPTEVFLKEGEEPPAESKVAREDLPQEELLKQPVHILHRPKKDPREIKVLDPACGSGHFLLYCFDLLQVIYEEAYDDPDLGASLRRDYPALVDLRRAVPELILKHNLHGIDIDLRATQIAALALWLRCQRAYRELALKNGERPKITRSNIVCAEPMPGETDLLKEFTANLQPKVLGQLVEVVFEKMKLAGEAGSLLKIEEEIREASIAAKKEYQQELLRRKEQAGYLPGMAPPRERTLFDFSDMTHREFLDRAEEEIVAALRLYAEKTSNGKAFRRRLFAEDAARGFAFIDLCRKHFDVVLMNPPFGLATKDAFEYIERSSPLTYVDLYASFVERGICLSGKSGLVGAISSRSFITMSRLEEWRRRSLVSRLSVLLDLGLGVMDDAFVEACAYVTSQSPLSNDLVAIDLRNDADKEAAWRECGFPSFNIRPQKRWFCASRERLLRLPQAKVLYAIDSHLSSLLSQPNRFEPLAGIVRTGLTTFDDFRFIRLFWESPADSIGKGVYWEFFSKGGEYAKYYTDVHLLVNRRNDGEELAEANRRLNGQTAQSRQGSKHYYKPGLTFTSRSARGFTVRVLPADCIISHNAPSIYGNEDENNAYLIAWLNSRTIRTLVELQANATYYTPGSVKDLPWIEPDEEQRRLISEMGSALIEHYTTLHTADETGPKFYSIPLDSSLRGTHERMNRIAGEVIAKIQKLQHSVSEVIDQIYGLQTEGLGLDVLGIDADKDVPVEMPHIEETVARSISYAFGCVLGRWDARAMLGKYVGDKSCAFHPIPICPPGMLKAPDGLPAKPEDVPSDYPIRIDWDGILVDDPEHEDDIVRRVRDVLEVIWKERAEAIEKEACEIMGVRELRDYFRKPGNGGFWMDHVKRYSKSRRKAPIYWYLRSAKGNYGLWLYYHRLDKDILFKVLLNYVEPKIRLEEDRLNSLRARKEKTGSSGREAKQIEKDMDRQEQFVSELHDFADKLRRAANLYLTPDLNDGVVLNIAPLWELAPWKEAKQYWDELVEGRYEWSSIGKQLREKGLVR